MSLSFIFRDGRSFTKVLEKVTFDNCKTSTKPLLELKRATDMSPERFSLVVMGGSVDERPY